MNLIPHEEIRPGSQFNFAPMIDFLFLMLALFATLAISRANLYDSEINLASITPEKEKSPLKSKHEMRQIHLSIDSAGSYKWLTELQGYPMDSIAAIQEELARQYHNGILTQDQAKTEILLHIDKEAPWESIARAIFGIRELGFAARPVYEEP
ncbi:MAG TPA: biopolymer transporter ExbD [Chlamydiales bacterium]|nr:biopolymer transporter ExbD [Chlamydiales bacterium]